MSKKRLSFVLAWTFAAPAFAQSSGEPFAAGVNPAAVKDFFGVALPEGAPLYPRVVDQGIAAFDEDLFLHPGSCKVAASAVSEGTAVEKEHGWSQTEADAEVLAYAGGSGTYAVIRYWVAGQARGTDRKARREAQADLESWRAKLASAIEAAPMCE